MTFKNSSDGMFIAIAQTSNSYLISHSINIDNDYAMEIFRDKLKKYNGIFSNSFLIQFENYDFNKLKDVIDALMASIKKFEIGDNLYNIDHDRLSATISQFIKNYAYLGITHIPLHNSLISTDVIEGAIPTIRMNVQRVNDEISSRYLPEILKIRAIYSDANKYENIRKLVNKIYLSPTHNFTDSFFDKEGKALEKLYYDWYKWYGFGTNNNLSMLAIGAFGFNDIKGVYFLAFHRLISHIERLRNKNDWRNIDRLLPELIESNYDLSTLFVWMIRKNLISGDILLQAAPLQNIIPNKIINLYKKSFNDHGFDAYVKNIYPNLIYELIE